MSIQEKLLFYSAAIMVDFMTDLLNWSPPPWTLIDFCGSKITKMTARVKNGFAEDTMENVKCLNMHRGNASMANILNSMFRSYLMM